MSTQTREPVGIPEWDLTDRLRKSLKEAGVSVQAMADELRLNRVTVGNYLAGRTTPTRAVIVVWALKCGVDVTWLETGNAAATPPDDGGSVNGESESACTRSAQVTPIIRQLFDHPVTASRKVA